MTKESQPNLLAPGLLAPGLLEPGLLAPDWAKALQPLAGQLAELDAFLRAETASGRSYVPNGSDVLRAFSYPMNDVKVLIVGQDPYPTPGHAIGLSFAVDSAVRPIPRSLNNIYKELQSDLGISAPLHGDLTAWSKQGVMLLNRVLTVQAGCAGSHRKKGWEAVTEFAISSLVSRGKPFVAILWGKDAARLKPILDGVPIIESAHPSPLSARRGFFGSKPFSRANELLIDLGLTPIDWQL